jgi:hypothetical protein
MNRVLSGIALISLILTGSQSLSLDLTSQSAISKKQISGCMTKRMLANRALSYNDARKSCSEQLKGQNASISSGPQQVVSVGGPGLAR